MKLKLKYAKREDLPAGYEELYDEKDGEFVLTGVEGMKTDADITRLTTSLANERKDHKATKEKLAVYADLDPTEVHAKLDRVEELEAEVATLKKSGGKDGPDEQAIERLVESRVKRAVAPIERERDALKKANGELTAKVTDLDSSLKGGKIERTVSKYATDLKVVGTAMDDVLLNANQVFEVAEDGEVVTREGVKGVTPGLTPDVWLKDMQEKRPHWWAPSVGGGAGGGHGSKHTGANPFSAKDWNMTEQGKLVRENPAKAEQLAQLAGTKVGGPRPAIA